MELATNDAVEGEPEDGWVTAPTLIDTQILMLLLCRFTGEKVGLREECPDRLERHHPDVYCKTLFLQAEGLNLALVDGGQFPEVNEEIRAPFVVAGEPIGTRHP